MQMDIKTQLHEGMKIAPLDNQEKEYILIQSNKDNCMYGLYQKEIIKLDDLDDELDTKWICTSLASFKDEIKCVQIEGKRIVSFDDFCIYKLASMIEQHIDEEYSVGMKILRMTREEYMVQKGFTYAFKVRDIIAQTYKQAKEVEKK